MRTLAVVVTWVLNLLAFGTAFAHGDHDPTHGGIVGQGSDEIVVEFVMEKGTLNLYVDDEQGQPLAVKNLGGSLTLVPTHGAAQDVKLVAAGENKFAAPGVAPVRGDRLIARITLPGGEEVKSVALFLAN